MAPPPGRVGGTVKLPVQVRMFPEEIAAVDAFAAELSQQSYGAAFSRAEALRIAAMEWLKERQARQARGTPTLSQRAPAATPALCWIRAAANASTAALSSGNMRTWTSSVTVPPTRPGGGAIVPSFPLSSTVCEPPVRRAQHAHACHARGRHAPEWTHTQGVFVAQCWWEAGLPEIFA